MNFKYTGNETLNNAVEEIFEVIASNSLDNNVNMQGWNTHDIVEFSGLTVGNNYELADLIKIKLETLENSHGTDNAIEIFRQANVSVLQDDELGYLFDKIDRIAGEYEPDEPKTKVRSKMKP